MCDMSNPANQERIMDVIRECADSMVRIAAERDLIKNTIKDISKDLEIPGKVLRKMVRVYYKQNFEAEVAEQEEFKDFYEQVVK